MRRLLLLPLALLLPTCVYTSPVPLGEPSDGPFDEALIGGWVGIDRAGELPPDTAPPRILRFNEHEYLIEWTEWKKSQADSEPQRIDQRVRAFITVFDSVRILNLEDLNESGEFVFARYSVAGDTLRLRFIAHRDKQEVRGLAEQYATTQALHAAVRARVNDPMLYEEDETVLRRARQRLTGR